MCREGTRDNRPRRRYTWGAGALLMFLLLLSNETLYFVPTGSMAPAIRPGSYVLVSRLPLAPRLSPWGPTIPAWRSVCPGEIVAVRPARAGGIVLLKRVAGVGGDTLSMREGRLYRNGRAVTEWNRVATCRDGAEEMLLPAMRWTDAGWLRRDHVVDMLNWPAYVVPDGHVFVLGDNICRSLDSRFWGLATDDEIVGQVLLAGRS